jgi:hypothetical protein
MLALGAVPAMAAPLPVSVLARDVPNSLVQSVREQKTPSKTQAAKAWVKTKKNQTVEWMDRQKTKLKRLAD